MRPSEDAVFMAIAREVAKRATCRRAQVGCVLVRGRDVVATGYNGAPRGVAHCTDVGCWMVDGHCRRALHAEHNAASRAGAADTAYVTHSPCLHCVQALHLVGVRRVVYASAYRMDESVLAGLRDIYGMTFEKAQEVEA